jgi:hypothetical protein
MSVEQKLRAAIQELANNPPTAAEIEAFCERARLRGYKDPLQFLSELAADATQLMQLCRAVSRAAPRIGKH